MRRKLDLLFFLILHFDKHKSLARIIDQSIVTGLIKQDPSATKSFLKAHHFKYLRPYLSLAFTTSQRFATLRSYHETINASCHENLNGGEFRTTATLWRQSSDNHKSCVTVGQAVECALEGDLTLAFVMDALELYRITFSIFDGSCIGMESGRIIFIGGIQGLANCRDQMRSAARHNGEIAPRDMLMMAIRSFAQAFDVGRLVGVSKVHNVSQLYASHDIHFDYDVFWQNLGGHPTPVGYALDVDFPEKPLSEVAATHRSRTKRKRALKSSIMQTMTRRASELFPSRPCPPDDAEGLRVDTSLASMNPHPDGYNLGRSL